MALLAAALLEGAAAFTTSPMLRTAPAGARTVSTGCMGRRRPLRLLPAAPRMSAGGESEGLTDADMKGLMDRVCAMSGRVEVAEVPLLVLDAMLPGQHLNIDTTDPVFKALADAASSGSFGMLGIDPAAQSMLRYGVQVDFIRKEEFPDHLSVEIVGRRRFALLGEPWKDERGFFMGRVEFMHDDAKEENELAEFQNERVCRELEGLVQLWTNLVVNRGKEHHPGQIKEVMADLGPLPPSSKPMELAMWVAALINPLPELGVSLEIRPAVLCAPTPGEALGVVLDNIKMSIENLKGGSNPMGLWGPM